MGCWRTSESAVRNVVNNLIFLIFLFYISLVS